MAAKLSMMNDKRSPDQPMIDGGLASHVSETRPRSGDDCTVVSDGQMRDHQSGSRFVLMC